GAVCVAFATLSTSRNVHGSRRGVLASDADHTSHHLRRSAGDGLHSAGPMGVGVALFPAGAVLRQSWVVGVDAFADLFRGWIVRVLETRTGGWVRVCRGAAGVLFAGCLLSGLGGNLVIRQ